MSFKLPCGLAIGKTKAIYMHGWTQEKVGIGTLAVWLLTLNNGDKGIEDNFAHIDGCHCCTFEGPQ